jgi:hypothetical protein
MQLSCTPDRTGRGNLKISWIMLCVVTLFLVKCMENYPKSKRDGSMTADNFLDINMIGLGKYLAHKMLFIL